MNVSRLKNIIIALLLLVNVCLLALLAGRSAQGYAARVRTEKELARLFGASGIDLPGALVPRNPQPAFLVEPIRDQGAEAALAETILGACAVEDAGGGAYRYRSEWGECLFRANGALEGILERPVSDWQTFCADLFPAYGYEIATAQVSADDAGTVSALRKLPGGAVFNAPLTLRFADANLVSCSGVFLSGTETTADESGMDGVTALVRFLDYSRGSGEVCTAVTEVRAGYLLQNTALLPVWRIVTDVNRYYVDRATGAVTRAP